jgi:hypothetical protein
MNTTKKESVSATSPVFLKMMRNNNDMTIILLIFGVFAGMLAVMASLFPIQREINERRKNN